MTINNPAVTLQSRTFPTTTRLHPSESAHIQVWSKLLKWFCILFLSQCM